MKCLKAEMEYQELCEVNAWLDDARFDSRLTKEEQDACWVVLSAVARLQKELEE